MRRLLALLAAALLLITPAAAQKGPTGGWRGSINASSGLVAAGATLSVTLAGQPNLLSMLSGFEFTVASTAATEACSSFTITGLSGGTMTYAYCAPAGAQAPPIIVEFPTPIPASAPGVSIVGATAAALPTGETAALNLHGYLLQ